MVGMGLARFILKSMEEIVMVPAHPGETQADPDTPVDHLLPHIIEVRGFHRDRKVEDSTIRVLLAGWMGVDRGRGVHQGDTGVVRRKAEGVVEAGTTEGRDRLVRRSMVPVDQSRVQGQCRRTYSARIEDSIIDKIAGTTEVVEVVVILDLVVEVGDTLRTESAIKDMDRGEVRGVVAELGLEDQEGQEDLAHPNLIGELKIALITEV